MLDEATGAAVMLGSLENSRAVLAEGEATPAWTSNRLKRLVLSPKRYVLDPAWPAHS